MRRGQYSGAVAARRGTGHGGAALRSATALAAAAITGLALAGTATAQSAPAPDHGSTTGGTVVSIELPAPVSAISVGGAHTLALGADGDIYAWGENDHGQLGVGSSTADVLEPRHVTPPTDVTFTHVAAGTKHSLALSADGFLFAWGLNDHGQLGTGSFADSATPAVVVSPPGVKFSAIAAGPEHSLALSTTGTVYAWGSHGHGRLGDGDSNVVQMDQPLPIPVDMPGGVKATAIAAGFQHSAMLGDDGQMYVWGRNQFGQLADGTSDGLADTPQPIQRGEIPVGAKIIAVTAGSTSNAAIADDGHTYTWGQYERGRLGLGAISAHQLLPARVPGHHHFTELSLSTAGAHSVARTADGAVYGWGYNNNGQTGTDVRDSQGDLIDVWEPTLIKPGSATGQVFSQVSAGKFFTVALASDGQIYAWGRNSHGQLGNGASSSTSPAAVPVTTKPGALPEVNVISISFGTEKGTHISRTGTNTFSVTAPKHDAGTVDVQVNWKVGALSQAPLTFSDGYTYDAPAGTKGTCPPDPFPDVTKANLHCGNIAWLKGTAITIPKDGNYHPGEAVNRGQMALFLYRLTNTGVPAPQCNVKPFRDVEIDNQFCGAIQWASDHGVTFGVGDGTNFAPERTVTRGQMSAFLKRVGTTDQTAPCTSAAFTDVPQDHLFCGTIQWMSDHGITSGTGDGSTYSPESVVNRDQMASFLHRIYDYRAAHPLSSPTF